MNAAQLSEKAFHYVWSALHFPNEPNHAGKKIMELLKFNAMSSLSKSLFIDLENNRNFSNANTILTEMENLFMGNQNLQNQVREAIVASPNDSLIPMPPIERDLPQEYSQTTSSASQDSGTSFGEIVNIILTIVSIIGLIARCSR
jgi:hypothetical protein